MGAGWVSGRLFPHKGAILRNNIYIYIYIYIIYREREHCCDVLSESGSCDCGWLCVGVGPCAVQLGRAHRIGTGQTSQPF
jgi:hypothetical protein